MYVLLWNLKKSSIWEKQLEKNVKIYVCMYVANWITYILKKNC